jgi:hypothetical protein
MTYDERLRLFKSAVILQGTTITALAREWDCSTRSIYSVLDGSMTSARLSSLIMDVCPDVTFEDAA